MKNMEVPPKFLNLATILAKDEYLNLLLKMAVNKGESILNTKANTGNSGEAAEQIGWLWSMDILNLLNLIEDK